MKAPFKHRNIRKEIRVRTKTNPLSVCHLVTITLHVIVADSFPIGALMYHDDDRQAEKLHAVLMASGKCFSGFSVPFEGFVMSI